MGNPVNPSAAILLGMGLSLLAVLLWAAIQAVWTVWKEGE